MDDINDSFFYDDCPPTVHPCQAEVVEYIFLKRPRDMHFHGDPAGKMESKWSKCTITHSTTANYAGIVCALNFQRLADILNNTSIWAFSLANDSSTHYRNFYFNNRIRFHLRGILYNIDAIAIPMFD